MTGLNDNVSAKKSIETRLTAALDDLISSKRDTSKGIRLYKYNSHYPKFSMVYIEATSKAEAVKHMVEFQKTQHINEDTEEEEEDVDEDVENDENEDEDSMDDKIRNVIDYCFEEYLTEIYDSLYVLRS
jgi:hypothetical protein